MFGRSKQRSFLNLRHWNSTLTVRVPSHYSLQFPTANLIGILLCYVVGAYGFSTLLLLPLIIVLFLFWIEKDRCLRKTVEMRVERRLDKQKVIGNGAETLEWVNFVFDKWWSCNVQTVSDFAKDWIEPIIDKFKLPLGIDSIEIVAFNSGIYRPHFSNLKLLEQTTAGADSFEPVTMATLATPPGANNKQNSVVLEVDVEFNAPEANLILVTRVGHKKFGQDFEMNVDSFHLTGRLRCFISASASVPFRHLTTAKVSFVREPHIEASCKILKETVQVLDIPVLRDVMMEYVIYGFKKLLVYPNGIDIDFSSPREPSTEWETLLMSGLAQGVLTVTVSGVKPDSKATCAETDHCCSLRLGSQKCVRQFAASKEPWSSTFSFLIHDLQEQELSVKLKCKRMLRMVTMVTRRIELRSLGFEDSRMDKPIFRKVTMSCKSAHVMLTLCYSPLPTFSLIKHHPPPPLVNEIHCRDEFAGVLYIHIHGAKDLIGYRCCDPYCIVTVNTKKSRTLFSTRSIASSPNPIWEQGVEILVPDYTTVTLTLEVTNQTARYGSLGSTIFNINPGQTHLIQQSLPLTAVDSNASTRSPLQDYGCLYISTVFRPVESVSHTVRSLVVDYVSRTHKHSLANCLDITTDLLNPSVHAGLSAGITEWTEESSRCYSNSDSGDSYSDGCIQ